MPVAFASRKLNACERRYSQLDKEGLSVVFGVCKFHKYLEGRKFRIQTDHKPLLGLFTRAVHFCYGVGVDPQEPGVGPSCATS